MVQITAEIASHWKGDFVLLEWLIAHLKNAGFDAVKFQAISKDRLARHPELRYYPDSSITESNIAKVDAICRKHGMPWYCTVTFPEAVKYLDDYVNTYKIANYDSDRNEIKDVVFGMGKKVIISTARPFKHDDKRIVNLYCIGRYPTPYEDINFEMMPSFDGYSCHTPDFRAVLCAVEKGIKYLEVHITPTKDKYYLDNPVSFSIAECYDLVRLIRKIENSGNNPSTANLQSVSEQSTL